MARREKSRRKPEFEQCAICGAWVKYYDRIRVHPKYSRRSRVVCLDCAFRIFAKQPAKKEVDHG